MIKINIPLFPDSLYFYHGDDLKKFEKDMSKFYLDYKFDDGMDGCCSGNMIYIKNYSINTISHELMHYILDLSKRLNLTGEETKAYLMGYLMEKIYTKLKDKIK